MAIFGVSVVLMMLVQGSAPFGLVAEWSAQGYGTSFVLTHSEMKASIGDRVVGHSQRAGEVTMYTVEEVLRRNGELYYRVSDPMGVTGGALISLPARELNRSAVLTVPFFGAWVRALDHPVGMMALLGLPLLMFVFNLGNIVGRRLLPVLHTLEVTQRYNKNNDDMVTVLRSNSIREKYGL